MEQFSGQDVAMMALAIRLAKQGAYTTTPNPNVGCVITDKNGEIVGQGWHRKAGTPHAEVHALKEAGEKARGATAYVTLEPCSHQGRTPPCADALIKAGVARVVAAMVDPNPLVSGRGLNRIKEAGIEVAHGLLSHEAEALNPGFIKRMRKGLPRVTLKMASSLDGKIALANGKSQWITGPQARQDVQRHRARSCAILSGSGTVLADNPSLNVRYNELGELSQSLDEQNLRQPLRIILDGRNQLTGDLKLFSLPGDVLIINRKFNPDLPESAEQWQGEETKGNKLNLLEVFNYLAERQLNDIWVEAGSRLGGVLLQEKLIDELILYQAPKLIGDKGQSLLAMNELTEMQQVFQLKWQDSRMVGEDLKFTAALVYPEQ